MNIPVENFAINDIVMAQVSDANLEIEQTYAESPQRNATGEIAVYPDYYYNNRILTVRFNYLTLDEYALLLNTMDANHFKVHYFDSMENKYTDRYFYRQAGSLRNNGVDYYGKKLRGYSNVSVTFVDDNTDLQSTPEIFKSLLVGEEE